MKIKIYVLASFLCFSLKINASSEAECNAQKTAILDFKSHCEYLVEIGKSSYNYDSVFYRYQYDENLFAITCHATHTDSTSTTFQDNTPWMPLNCSAGSERLVRKAPRNNTPIVQCGSIIEPSNQVVGERIPVVGVNFDLWYFSNRVIGKKSDYATVTNISPGYVRPSVTGYTLSITNENNPNIITENFLALPSLTYQYIWNGLDSNLNETWGPVKSTLSTHEIASDTYVEDIAASLYLGNLKAKKLGLGGWLPSIWHFYHAPSNTLYKGDGSFRSVEGVIEGIYTRVADKTGNEVYYFDSTGKIVFTKLGLTGTTIYSFGYDSSERLTSITEPFNKVTNFIRWSNGKLKKIVAPNGKITLALIDSNGYLSKITNPINESFTMSYHGTEGLLHTFQKPSGDITTLVYDTLGDLISDSHSNGFSVSLTKNNSSVLSTSSLGRVTTNTYTTKPEKEVLTKPSGFMKTITNYEGYSEVVSPNIYQTIYYSNHPRFGVQSPSVSSNETYNFGRRETIITNFTSLNNSEDPFSINTMVDEIDVGSSKTTISYSGANKSALISSKLGKTAQLNIDQYQRPLLFKIGNTNSIDFTYSNELLTKVTQGSRENLFSYNANGLLSSIENSLGQVTSVTYDNADRLQTLTLPDLRVIDLTYDFNGNLTSITPPARSEHKMNYGTNDRMSSYQPPSITGITNVVTNYEYNDDNQLTKIKRPDGEDIDLTYDSTTGLLNSISGTFGVNSRSYDNEKPSLITDQYNNNLSISYTRGVASGFSLNNDGTGIYNYARSPHYQYGGRVGSETINGEGSGSVSQDVYYSYNNDEDLTVAGSLQLSYDTPNGNLTGTTLDDVTDSYTYNAYGEVSAYQAKYLTNVIYEYSLTRDAVGRVSQKTELINGITKVFIYSYDSAGRLIEVKTNGVVTSTYTYDGNSNRIGGSIRGENTLATYDGQDRLTNYNSIAFTYNENGELLTKGAVNTNYDVFGNLKSYTNGSIVVSYEIDPLQRRLGTIVGSSLNSRFIYNPEGLLVGQLDSANKLQKSFVYASRKHVPDYYIDSSNNKFRIISDYLGSVRLVVSSSGVVSEIMEHDEFGRVLQDTSPGLIPFGFAGGLYDFRTGLVRFGVRDYDSQTGRWLSKDPILFDGMDTNLYGYVLQDPINLIDVTGESPLVAIGMFIGGLLMPTPMETSMPIEKDVLNVAGGVITGGGVGGACSMAVTGSEIVLGDSRIAPFGNRTGNPTGKYPHYHRRGIDPTNGKTIPGQGIGRHRPWDLKSTDKSFWDRF